MPDEQNQRGAARKQSAQRKKLVQVTNGLAVASAAVGAALSLVVSLNFDKEAPVATRDIQFEALARFTAVRIQTLQQRIADIQLVLEQSSKPSDPKTDQQVKALLARISELEAREERLERSIVGNPQKALELPMLRKDLDQIKDANDQSIAMMKESISQIYDLTKWLLGTLVVGIASLAFSNYLGRK